MKAYVIKRDDGEYFKIDDEKEEIFEVKDISQATFIHKQEECEYLIKHIKMFLGLEEDLKVVSIEIIEGRPRRTR